MNKDRLKKNVKTFAERIANSFYRHNPTPIILLGNQKSGTTIIGKLISQACGLSFQLDIAPMWEENFLSLFKNEMTMAQLIDQHRKYFTADIIKEPNLTFFYDKLKVIYDESPFGYIVRHPVHNIRSILNRMNLPGDLPHLSEDELLQLQLAWKLLLESSLYPDSSGHYIDNLAHRWNACVDIYLKNKQELVLIRYEDFLEDKVNSIQDFVESFDLEMVDDITDKVDIQYQPKGNTLISPLDFFGKKNLQRIESICGSRMKQLGYTAITLLDSRTSNQTNHSPRL